MAEIMIYVALIMISQGFAYGMSVSLDLHGKYKKYSKVVRCKLNYIFFKSDFEKRFYLSDKGRPISRISFIFQIINMLMVQTFVIFAILGAFVYPYTVFMKVSLIIILSYCGMCFFGMFFFLEYGGPHIFR